MLHKPTCKKIFTSFMFTKKSIRLIDLLRTVTKHQWWSFLRNSSIVHVWPCTKYISEIYTLNIIEVSSKDNRVASIDAVELLFMLTLKIIIMLILFFSVYYIWAACRKVFSIGKTIRLLKGTRLKTNDIVKNCDFHNS